MPPVRPTTPEPLPPPEPRCDDVTLAEPPPGVLRDDFGSLWRHNCSIMGLVADLGRCPQLSSMTDRRGPSRLPSRAIPSSSRALTGAAASLAPRSNTAVSAASSVLFPVQGEAVEVAGTPIIRISGNRSMLDSNCRPTGTVGETPMEFSFVETISPRRIKPRSRGPGTSDDLFGAHAQLLGDYLLSRCAGADRGPCRTSRCSRGTRPQVA